MLLFTMFVLSGCNEIMSNLSNPVDSYLKLKEASVKIYRGQSYKIEFSTISDAKPIFKSADEKIVSVDANGVIKGGNKGKTTVTVTIPANDYYKAASAQFEVEVDAVLSLPVTEKEIAPGESYNIEVITESNGLITYKSSNTKVATVDNSGNVTAVACGDATITISIAATPQFDREETAEFTAKVRVQNLDQLKAVIAASNEVTALLGQNANITFDSDINLSGKKILIKGEKDKEASLKFAGTFTEAAFIVNNSFELENVNVDASSLSKPLILFPEVTLSGDEKAKNIDIISFTNSKISGANTLVECNKQKYLLGELKVEKSIIAYNGTTKKTIFNFNSGGNVTLFKVNESTIYANPKVAMNGGFFSTQSGNEVTNLGGTNQEYVITNSTLYNITNGNDMNTLRSKDQSYVSFTFEKNIIVDCGKNKQFYKGFAGASDAKKCTWNVDSNVNNWGGADTSGDETVKASNENVKNPIKTIVTFADVANGDFSQSDANVGDPRWIKK